MDRERLGGFQSGCYIVTRIKEVTEWYWIAVLKPGSYPLKGTGDKKYAQKRASRMVGD